MHCLQFRGEATKYSFCELEAEKQALIVCR
jgi:hypothetical protein